MAWGYASNKLNTRGRLSQIATKVGNTRTEQSNIILVDAGDTIQGNFVETFNDDLVNSMMLGFNHLKDQMC
nr:2,' 3'-cyclic nucleotide 2'-phosphodiesterase [Vibrio cyclitrophicus]